MYKDNRKIEINNKGECEMIALKNDRNVKEISEENVDLLKVMAHPVRLQIVNELMHHKKMQCYTVNGNIKTPSIHCFTAFIKIEKNRTPYRKKRIRGALLY